MQKFEMDGEHLARTLATTRKRERAKVATEIDNRADLEDGKGHHETAKVLRELAVQVLGESVPGAAKVVAATTSGGERDPLDEVDEIVAEQERALGTNQGLPPVHHLNDEQEGLAMVRNLGARGKLNLPRD